VATVTVSNLGSDTTFTCSFANVSDTCTVTVPQSQKIQTTITEVGLSTDFGIDWTVDLKDSNNTRLVGKPVKFYLDNVYIETITVEPFGGASWSNYDYWDGTHTIKAVFEGDNDYEASQLEKTVTIGF